MNSLLTILVAIWVIFAASCEKDTNTNPVTGDTRLPPPVNPSNKMKLYSENGTSEFKKPENTGYILDTIGLIINGSLGENETDYFQFNTADLERLNVTVYIEGRAQTTMNHEVYISLDAVDDDGYSSLMGDGYFANAWIQKSMEYSIAIGGLTGTRKEYSIVLQGSQG
jgi:hypothetical protein